MGLEDEQPAGPGHTLEYRLGPGCCPWMESVLPSSFLGGPRARCNFLEGLASDLEVTDESPC